MRRLICVSVCLLIMAASAHAQSPNATVTGEVVDPSGATIANATVDFVSEATNVRYSTKTNSEGIYVVSGLPPGTYHVEVSHAGFKTVLKPDLIFNVRDAVAINFKLPIGALSEVVTVEAGISMINTTDASVSTVVDQAYVANMPLNGRSFQDLILLTPGTVTQTPQISLSGGLGQTGEFSVNGQRTESNYYTVDGVSANVGGAANRGMMLEAGASGSLSGSTAVGTTQALVSVDALQEFRVQSSTYSAEYGRNPGGQFAFQTKSGTNQWHGTAYDYLRNGFFDAQDWYNDYFRTPEPALRQNDFGATLGGPFDIPGLYNGKNKTFFFVSYEGLRLAAPQAASANPVPDAALRASTPAPLQTALNVFPRQSPNGIDDTATGVAQFIGSWTNPSSLDSTSVRFDHVVRDNLKIFFRFSNTTSTSAARVVPSILETSGNTMRTYTAGVTSGFTLHLNNEFRLNYSSNELSTEDQVSAFGGTAVDLRQLLGLGPTSQPDLNLALGGPVMTAFQSEFTGAQRQWNLANTMTLSLGRHQFKFGADYRRLAPLEIPSSPHVLFIYFGKSAVQNNAALTRTTANGPGYPLYKNFSAFVQDQWNVSQRLTLSLGLRWEVNPPPGVTQGLTPYTIQGTSFDNYALAPQGTPLWRTTWYNFAPRVGVAYIIHNAVGWETVVRGGVGVFFDTGQQAASGGFVNGPGFAASFRVQPNPFPSYPSVPTIVNPPSTNNISVYGFYPHLQLPYTVQWNTSIEQALGKSQALTFSYVGSHASRLLQLNDVHSSSNPNLKNFLFVENGLTSDYDSFQIQFRRRLSQGATALASYGWSHCLDYGSTNYNFAYERGNCDFDVRQKLSTAFSYDLPDFGGSGFEKVVLHHWGIDNRFTARTAFPVTLVGSDLLQPNGQFYHAGLDLVPGQQVYLYGSTCDSVLQGLGNLQSGEGCPGGRDVNPQAFTQVPTDPTTGYAARQGTAPRNFVRGFGAWQMDVAVRRDFPIRERLKLQFRAEAFNIFNHPNFGTIDPFFGDITFGQATATLARSLGGLNPLYQQGGARSMQFALKLLF